MVTIDLDAARAARLEASGGVVDVVFGGERFAFPPEISLEAINALTVREDPREFLVEVLGEDAGLRFWSHHPSLQDIQELSQRLAQSNGFSDVGESSASSSSSKTTGSRPRRTSSASTGSTSRKRSTAKPKPVTV